MEVRFRFDQKTISGFTSDTILESFLKNNLIIAHSCLNGRCSACKVKVIEGEFVAPANQEGLTDDEIQKGFCLTCITKPLTDLKFESVEYVNGLLPEIKRIPVKINELEFLSKEVVKVKLRTPPGKCLKYLPGQYVDLVLNNTKRSYSVASDPTSSLIELLIKKHENGLFSDYFFNKARVHDLLSIVGPRGSYILPESTPSKLVFVSTGTGIAPNLAIIKSLLADNAWKRLQIILIHGQRTVEEHIYDLDDIIPGAQIIKVTSRELAEGFIHGHVQDVFGLLSLDMSDIMVFACGNPEMIKDLRSLLISRGLDVKNFKSDVFVPTT